MEASIVVTTYYRPRYLELVLDSILGLEGLGELAREVIVVTAEGDEEARRITMDWARRAPVEARVLRVPEDATISAMRNAGLRSARAPVGMIVDDDVLLHPRTLSRALQLLGEYPDAAAVAFPTPQARMTLEDKLHHARYIGVLDLDAPTVTPVTAFRLEALERAGYYREDLGPPRSIHEDWELAARLRRHGYRIIIDGHTVQVHKPPLPGGDPQPPERAGRPGLLAMARSYVTAYLRGRWRTLLLVLSSGPRRLRLEYAGYTLLPWLAPAGIISPLALLALAGALAGYTGWSLARGYWRSLPAGERLLMPLLLLAVRSARANLSLLGYLAWRLGLVGEDSGPGTG